MGGVSVAAARAQARPTSALWVVWAAVVATPSASAAGNDVVPAVVTVQGRKLPSPNPLWDGHTDPASLPLSLDRVERETLDSLNTRRVEDLAGLVPGLQADVSSAGLSSAVKLRGFAVTRMHFNGQPDVQRLFARDLATVERVELLSGPAGLFHGIASPGGVLHYVGKQPLFDRQRTLRLGLDQHAVADTMLDLTGPLFSPVAGAPLAYRLVLSARDGSQPPASLPQRHRTVLGALAWAHAPGGRVTIESESMHNRTPYLFGTVITGGGTPAAQPQFDQLYVQPGGAPALRSMQRWALDWRQRLDNGVELSARYSQAKVARHETLLGFWALESDTELSGYYTRYDDAYRQAAFKLRAEVGTTLAGLSHHLAAGIERYSQRILFTGVQSIGGFTIAVDQPSFDAVDVAALPLTPRYNHETQRDHAVWASDRIRLTDATSLTAGFRRTQYRIEGDRTGAGLKPATAQQGDAVHLGATTLVTPQLRGHVSAATGFEPNRGVTRSGEYLPPQRQRQIEAGLRWQPAAGLRFDATAYRIRLSQIPMTDRADRTAVIASGERQVQGLQLGTRLQTAGLALDAHVVALAMRQLVRTSPGLGDAFPGVARRSAGLRVVAPGPWRWTMAVSAVGPRAVDGANTTELPGYALAHLSIEQTLAPGRTINAGVRNLFDKRYIEAVTALDDAYQGPRRQAWVRLEQGF